MNRTHAIILTAVAALVLLGCALLVRDGLRSIAKEIHAKPWPQMPDALNVKELTVQRATIESPLSGPNASNRFSVIIKQATIEGLPGGTNGSNSLKMTIDNLKLDAQVSQPKEK